MFPLLSHSAGRSSLAVLGLLASSGAAILTSGAPNTTGIQFRREIRDLMGDQPSWYLFIQALTQVYAADQSSLTGYYQISGIHGEPQIAYDGVKGLSNPDFPGYCPHDSNLFTTWHRPYLALLEQQLVAAAQSIAQQYNATQYPDFVGAANNLRLPYFDWAKNSAAQGGAWVANFSTPNIQIVSPAGNVSVANPLYRYTFHPSSGNVDYPWSQWNTTLRWPASNKPTVQSNNAKCATNINANQAGWQDRVYKLITQPLQYNQFSNTQCPPKTTCTDSVEGVHNEIHNAIGGGGTNGHMVYPVVAAFDPTFWLHHCMVDRLFAIWQVAQNQTWFQPQTQSPGTFWYADQYVSKSNTPLKPFKQVGTTFWTSDTVRDWTQFQYTYPELPQGLATDTNALAASVNTLYGATSTPSRRRRFRFGKRTDEKEYTLAGTSANIREYTAKVRTAKNALGQPYTLFFFLGDYPSSPTAWVTSSNYIGSNFFLTRKQTKAQVAKAKPLFVGAATPLNRALLAKSEAGEITNLEDDSEVQAYLTANLHWAVQAADGSVIPPDQVPNLVVSVTSNEIVPATSITEFPTRVGKTQVHEDITKDKDAGLGS